MTAVSDETGREPMMLYLDRSEVRSILIGQPDECLHITESVLAEIDALPIFTKDDVAAALSAAPVAQEPVAWQFLTRAGKWVDCEKPDPEDFNKMGVRFRGLYTAPPATPAGLEEDWRDDPSADERWQAGLDYGMERFCSMLGVDPKDVRWDAATEELDGDVCAVIGNILRVKFGDDFDPMKPLPSAGLGADEIARAIKRDLLKKNGNHGCLVQNSTHLDSFIIRGHVDLMSLGEAILALLSRAGDQSSSTHEEQSTQSI